MEYFEFNKAIARTGKTQLIHAAGACRIKQDHIKDKIAELNEQLRQQQCFERKLQAKADAQ